MNGIVVERTGKEVGLENLVGRRMIGGRVRGGVCCGLNLFQSVYYGLIVAFQGPRDLGDVEDVMVFDSVQEPKCGENAVSFSAVR